MNSTEMLSTYESLCALTGTMLLAAREGEWEALAALEQRCRDYVGSLIAAAPVVLNAQEQRAQVAIIRTILQNDAKIRALTEPHMHQLQQWLSKTLTVQRGIQAYGE